LAPRSDSPGGPARHEDFGNIDPVGDGGLDDRGLIFRFPEESVCVYWSTARLEADTWIVEIDGAETYEVPLAAIEGG